MAKTAIVTDSNSGITQEKAEKYGIYVLPMPFYIDDELYLEGQTISHEEFYKKQRAGSKIYTSQPNPYDVTRLWDQVLETYDELVYIPMSSGLSGSCSTAMALAQEYDGRVVVVDNGRISVMQKYAVLDALRLARQGVDAAGIRSQLLYHKDDYIIYLTVADLNYLKKGGRITPAAAAVGNLLRIKPLLYLQSGKLDVAAKVRGDKAVRKKMLQTLEKDITDRFHAHSIDEFYLLAAACIPREEAKELKESMEEYFGAACSMSPFPLSIGAHTGFGAYGMGLIRK